MANRKDIKTFLNALNPTEEQGEKMLREILRKSNSKHQERTVYMKQKYFKSAAIAAAILVLCVTTALAAIYSDVLKTFFMGDSSAMQDSVKTINESVSDGRFKLTVNEVLADENRVYIVFSIEGLTDDAIAELMHTSPDDDFMYINTTSDLLSTVSISPHSGMSENNYSFLYEIAEKRTDTTRCWAYYDKFEDAIQNPLMLRLNKMSGEKYITVPTDCNVTTLNLTLAAQPYGDVYVNISPIGITIEKDLSTDYADTMMFTDVFFRMQNGEIKTYNQITSYRKAGMLIEENKYKRYRYDAQFFDTIPLSNFKSIIVGNVEYDINDPSKTSYVDVDKKLYPFELSANIGEGSRYFVPIQELCEKLGADIEWHDGKMSATINYQGRTVEITTAKDAYINFGDGHPYKVNATIQNGNLMVDNGTLLYGLNVWISEPNHESGEILPPDCIWVIIP